MTEYGYSWFTQSLITPDDFFAMNSAFKNVMKSVPGIEGAEITKNQEDKTDTCYTFYFRTTDHRLNSG